MKPRCKLSETIVRSTDTTDQSNQSDVFLSVYGVMHVIVNSQKEKGKQLRKWVLENIIPRGMKNKMKEIQEKHKQAIEEKEAALALHNNELTEVDSRLQKLEFDNVALQA